MGDSEQNASVKQELGATSSQGATPEPRQPQTPPQGKVGGICQINPPDSSDRIVNDAYKKISLLQELYVEFFGTFIPGFVLLVSSGILLFAFVITFFDQHPWASFNSDKTWNLHWYVAVFIVILSYVVGAILYRTEPNRPDKKASMKQWKRSSEDDRDRLAVQYPLPKGVDASFPYPNLREYLIRRGLTHLIAYVPWCSKNETRDFRTKVVINILKTRIRATYVYPIIQDIVRNEGHIRLMTSIWHVALYLLRFAFIAAFLSILWGYILYRHRNDTGSFENIASAIVTKEAQITTKQTPDGLNLSLSYLPIKTSTNLVDTAVVRCGIDRPYPFIVQRLSLKQFYQVQGTWLAFICGIVFFSACLAKGAIERSIHYVRNREAVMILESAYTIENLGGLYSNLFADFHNRTKQFEDCSVDKCKRCSIKTKALVRREERDRRRLSINRILYLVLLGVLVALGIFVGILAARHFAVPTPTALQSAAGSTGGFIGVILWFFVKWASASKTARGAKRHGSRSSTLDIDSKS